jgi:hypothetical protein
MKIKRQPSRLEKKSKRGFRGYPLATVAFYGPDAQRASKVVVGIILDDRGETHEIKRWFSEETDVRSELIIMAEILEYIQSWSAKSVVMTENIIGCPHEEGIDYPDGEVCPVCPYWAERDRWTGELLERQ